MSVSKLMIDWAIVGGRIGQSSPAHTLIDGKRFRAELALGFALPPVLES